jgi:hypothetical protein
MKQECSLKINCLLECYPPKLIPAESLVIISKFKIVIPKFKFAHQHCSTKTFKIANSWMIKVSQ